MLRSSESDYQIQHSKDRRRTLSDISGGKAHGLGRQVSGRSVHQHRVKCSGAAAALSCLYPSGAQAER